MKVTDLKGNKMIKKILVLWIALIVGSTLQAQQVNLRSLTPEQRKAYVIEEGYRALDEHLQTFKQELYGDPTIRVSRAQYFAFGGSYKENQLRTDESIRNFNALYGEYVTDYTLRKNDYAYTISFVKNRYVWNPLEYKVTVLNNGKALRISIIEIGYGKTIYKND